MGQLELEITTITLVLEGLKGINLVTLQIKYRGNTYARSQSILFTIISRTNNLIIQI